MRWTDLDAYGHVNNAAMLTRLEEARIAAFWSDGSSSQGADSTGPGGPGGAGSNHASGGRADVSAGGSTAAIGSAATKVLSGGPASETRTLVARQEIEYLAPLDYSQEPVDVELWIGRIGGASLLICYQIRGAQDLVCAKAASSIVKVDAATGAPVRFDATEREALQPLLDDELEFRRR